MIITYNYNYLFFLVSYTNDTCELFLHCFTQKLGRFLLLIPLHILPYLARENKCFLSSCSVAILFIVKSSYTAFMLLLVNFTETCGMSRGLLLFHTLKI